MGKTCASGFAPRGFKPTAGAQNTDYSYDAVGNQISDPHKGMTITYNYLNLLSINLLILSAPIFPAYPH